MYKAVIADDEKELRSYLKSMLADTWPDLEVCGEAANGKEALKLVETFSPDVIFLDIKMPGLNGLDVAQKIAGKCYIVFVTAFDDYAVEAFEHEAIDYLVKPVMKKRLTQTIQRLKKQFEISSKPPDGFEDMLKQVISNLKSKENIGYLHWIKTQYKNDIRLIPVEDVYYFQAKDKYTLVMTAEGESLIKKSIKELSLELDPQKYWQIHRSTIVNVSRIASVSRSLTGRGVLKLKDDAQSFVVSRNYLHLFKQM